MGHWDGMPWYGMIFGPIMMIAVLVAVVVVVVVIVRWLGGGPLGPSLQDQQSSTQNAQDILRARFARGEIDKEEFEERRRVLGE